MFVELRGDAGEKGRLRHILTGEQPGEAASRQTLAGQRDDGGWQPPWAPGYSSLDATCYRLAKCDELGLGPSDPALARALRFLLLRQQGDGAWEEEPEVSSMAPAWAMPGNREARLYLTANCGYWLARLAQGETGSLRESAARADRYLQTYLDEQGRLPSFWQTHWLAAGLWQHLGQTEQAEKICQFLESRVPEMPASSLAWLIMALRGVGLPPAHRLVEAAALRLAGLQAADGRWPGDEGLDSDVATTLAALHALKLAGML